MDIFIPYVIELRGRGRGGLGEECRVLALVEEVLVIECFGLANRGPILLTDAPTLVTNPAS